MKKMAALLAAMMFSLSLFGCEALDTTLPPQETQEQTAQTKSEKNTAKPQRALEQIYSQLGKRIGLVEEPTAEQIAAVVGLDAKDYEQAYVRYVETDFGADDVYIVLPKEGKDEEGVSHRENILSQLRERKDFRTREFANYDVYNSASIAENALIFERGGYVVMLMLEDNDSARSIIEKYIPGKTESFLRRKNYTGRRSNGLLRRCFVFLYLFFFAGKQKAQAVQSPENGNQEKGHQSQRIEQLRKGADCEGARNPSWEMRKLRKAARYIPSFCASSHWLSHWEEKRRESGSTFSKRGFIRLTMLTWETSTQVFSVRKRRAAAALMRMCCGFL